MNMEKVLENIGFKQNEARIYLAVLQMGEVTASELARDLNLPRTTVQEIFDHMHKRGFMNYYLKKTRKFWIAENPQKLVTILKEQENNLNSILPKLQSLRHSVASVPKVSIYRGAAEIKLIMDDLINSKQSIKALVAWDEWVDFFGEDYVMDNIERRAQHFLRIDMLAPRTNLSSELKKKDAQQLRRTKFLPESFDFRITQFIYGSKVALISMSQKDPMGILIEDEDIAHTMKLYFDTLWNQASSN